ncbi:MAG: FMN-binding negative transcriptional regulator [Meiothermus sp.]|nr:FMN-binding negative transcriptional regulator [Meiothermus sp.]
MYIPKFNLIEDVGTLLEFMRANSFATLVSVHGGVPFATHMPFVVESEGLLASHIARANPQWTSFEGQEVLVIFQGDHSFVSPTWYQKHPSVPTWNYMTVHAYGRVRIVSQPEAVKAMLHRLVLQYEQQWKMEELEEKFLHGMMQGIVAFEVEVTRLEGKFKLSQNRPEADQRGVAEALSQSDHATDRAVAAAMHKNLEG